MTYEEHLATEMSTERTLRILDVADLLSARACGHPVRTFNDIQNRVIPEPDEMSVRNEEMFAEAREIVETGADADYPVLNGTDNKECLILLKLNTEVQVHASLEDALCLERELDFISSL